MDEAAEATAHINHESSRKAFETWHEPSLSHTALLHINHESSRKAFETRVGASTVIPSRMDISITNLAERHLRRELMFAGRGLHLDLVYQSRI